MQLFWCLTLHSAPEQNQDLWNVSEKRFVEFENIKSLRKIIILTSFWQFFKKSIRVATPGNNTLLNLRFK